MFRFSINLPKQKPDLPMNENSTLKLKSTASESTKIQEKSEGIERLPHPGVLQSILNYSKSLRFESSKLLGQIELTTN